MNGSSVALDTNQAIALLNGLGNIGQWIARFGTIYLPVPVIGELLFGAYNSTKVATNVARVEKLLSSTTALPILLSTSELYARVRFGLRRQRRPIPGNDVWIASICIEHQLPLATVDAHFASIAGLVVVHP